MALPKEAPKTNLNPTRVEITSDGTQVAYGRVVPWYLRRKGDTQIPNLISEQDFKEKFPDHL